MAAIGTQSLSQLVKVKVSQKAALDLHKALVDKAEDSFLCEQFRPLYSQTEAIKAAAGSAVSGGSILLTGSCGSGKSTIMLYLGRTFASEVPSDEFTALIGAVSDVSVCKSLAQIHTGGHPWLTVVPDLKASDDFEAAARAALKAALSEQAAISDESCDEQSLFAAFEKISERLRSEGRFSGIVVLADNADALVKSAIEGTESQKALRDFCRECSSAGHDTGILLLAAIDRDISRFSLNEEEQILSIFQKVQPVALVDRGGEWEELIGSGIIEHVEGELWDSLLDYKDFRRVTEVLTSSGLYRGNSDRWIVDTVMQGAYPMHPAAVFALPRVSTAMAGRGRTAFNFFSDSAPGGLIYFLRNFAVVQPNGRLHLYTLDSLFTYFEKSFNADPDNAEYVKALSKSVMIAGDIPQARRILRTVLLIQIIASDRFKPVEELILWAMHLGDKETKVASHSLELLKQKKALEFNEKTGEYALPVEGRKVSIDEALPRMRNRLRSQLNVTSVIRSGMSMHRIRAEKFNEEFHTDRYARISVVMAADLSEPAKCMASFAEVSSQLRPYRGDVTLLLAVPESEEELNSLHESAKSGAFNNPRLALLVPAKPVVITKECLDVMALKRLCTSELPFCDPASEEHSKADELLQKANSRLEEALGGLLDVKSMHIYCNGEVKKGLSLDEIKDFVNSKIAGLVGNPPLLSDPSLVSLNDAAKSRRLRQNFVSYMFGCRGRLVLRENSPFLKLVESGLVETGLLEEKPAAGKWRSFEAAREIPDSAVGRAFKDMCSKLIGDSGVVSCVPAAEIVGMLRCAPYGFVPSLIELLAAFALWRFNDCLTIRRNLLRAEVENRPELLEDVEVSAVSVYDMVGSPADWQIRFCDCSKAQSEFLNGLLNFMCASCSEGSMWDAAGQAMIHFCETLPAASKVPGASGYAICDTLYNAVGKLAKEEHPRFRRFLESEVPAMFGMSADAGWDEFAPELLDRVKETMNSLDGVPSKRAQALTAALREVFSSYEGGDGELSWAVCADNWLKANSGSSELDRWPVEKEALAAVSGCVNASRALSILLDSLDWQPLDEWKYDMSGELLERFRSMRYDVEWGIYRRSCIMPSNTEAAYGVLHSVISNISAGDIEGFLASELEWAVWPEGYSAFNEGAETDSGDPAEWDYEGEVSEIVRMAYALEENKEQEEEGFVSWEEEPEDVIIESAAAKSEEEQSGEDKPSDEEEQSGKDESSDEEEQSGKDEPSDEEEQPGKDEPSDEEEQPGKDKPSDEEEKSDKHRPSDREEQPAEETGKEEISAEPGKDEEPEEASDTEAEDEPVQETNSSEAELDESVLQWL